MNASTPREEYVSLKETYHLMNLIAAAKPEGGMQDEALAMVNYYLPSGRSDVTDITEHIASIHMAKVALVETFGGIKPDIADSVGELMAHGIINRCQVSNTDIVVATSIKGFKLMVQQSSTAKLTALSCESYYINAVIPAVDGESPAPLESITVNIFIGKGTDKQQIVQPLTAASILTSADEAVVALSAAGVALSSILKRRVAALAGVEFVESKDSAQDDIDFCMGDVVN